MAPKAKKVICFKNAQLLRDHEFGKGDLWVADGKIVSPRKSATQKIDLSGMRIAPGLIDLQINGGFGFDFSSTVGGATEVARKLPRYGVTAFLPTLVTSDVTQYKKVFPGLNKEVGPVRGGAMILGIHLEGPFIHPSYAGAHQTGFILKTNPKESVEKIWGDLKCVKLVTLAPEGVGALDWIEALSRQGVLVSLGHSQADSGLVRQAYQRGARLVTHLFNAMPAFHHRSPGIIGAVLGDRQFHYSVIADGVHLDPLALRIAWNAHPEGLILVTDAMAAMGLKPGSYSLSQMKVDVKKDRAVLEGSQVLAGSVISLDRAVRVFHQSTGCTEAQAWEAASLRPAQILGVEKVKGHLQPGADADFVILNRRFEVVSTYVGGEKVWSA